MVRLMKVLILGGVAAGTKVAAKLKRQMGAACEVTVLTKGTDISYAGCGLPYYVGGFIADREKLIVNTPEKFENLTNTTVLCQTEATQIDRAAKTVTAKNLTTGEETVYSYDKLVIAVGADPVRPNLPGMELENVYTMRTPDDAVRVREAAGADIRRAVVVGGGFIGLELAENLAAKGIRTVVLEMAPQILPGFDADFADYAERKMAENGIQCFTGDGVTALEGDGRVSLVRTNNRKIKADLVVFSVGIRPNTAFLKDSGLTMNERGLLVVDGSMQTNDPDVYAVGDCAMVKNMLTGDTVWSPMGSSANMEGRVCAKAISGEKATYHGVMGTAVAKLSGLSVARTGMTEKDAESRGYHPISVTVTTDNKAHYYPDAGIFVIRLTADKDSHKLLGVQVAGDGAVDKVTDIVVMALAMGATVEDLENLDFCYAPPFSTAIHPLVHTVNVLLNKMNGQMSGMTAAEYLSQDEKYRLVDTIPGGAFEGLEKLPFTAINGIMDGFAPEDKLLLVCNKGRQAYLAQNRLMQYGYRNTKVLEGGAMFSDLEELLEKQ